MFIPGCFCCGTQPTSCGFYHDYSTLPSGWTTYTRSGSGIPVPSYSISGGRLVSFEDVLPEGSRGSFYIKRVFSAPLTSSEIGRMSLSTKIYGNGVASWQGIYLGTRVLYAGTSSPTAGVWKQECDYRGDVAADPLSGTSLSGTCSDGDVLSIEAVAATAGQSPSQWGFEYKKNGVSLGTETVGWTPTIDPSNFTISSSLQPYLGIWSHDGGQWDDTTFSCDIAGAVTCGSSGCVSNPLQWTFTISGVQDMPINPGWNLCGTFGCNASFNGTFVLTRTSPNSCVWISQGLHTGCCALGSPDVNPRWRLYNTFSNQRWDLEVSSADLKVGDEYPGSNPGGFSPCASLPRLVGNWNNFNIGSGSPGTYRTWNCLSDNVMTGGVGAGIGNQICLNWPTSITLSPA